MAIRKYIRESSFKTARLARIIAKGIDLFIVLILSFLFYPLGIILSFIYLALSDSLQGGQSVGKRAIGLCVISLEDGSPCSFKQSAIRNLPFLVPLFFALIPLWGWFLALLIGIPLTALELYLLFRLDSGHRLGDVMADTSVMANDRNQIVGEARKNSWFAPSNSSNSPSSF